MAPRLLDVPLNELFIGDQVRAKYSPTLIERMSASLNMVGQLYPLLGRRIDRLVEVVDGGLRILGAEANGWNAMAVLVCDEPMDAKVALGRQIIANHLRHQLDPIELGLAFQRFMDEQGTGPAQAARELCVTPAMFTKMVKPLAGLEDSIKEAIRSRAIPHTAAYYLLRLDPAARKECARRLMAGEMTRDELAESVKRPKRGVGRVQMHVPRKVTMALGNRQSVTIAGEGIATLDELIATMKSALALARKHRARGLDLNTFLRLAKKRKKAGRSVTA